MKDAIKNAVVTPRNPENPRRDRTPTPDLLRGWRLIARHLGMPVSTAQRWAKSGMPVTRSGRNVLASREELDRWLDRDSKLSPSTHIVTDRTVLLDDLKHSLREANRSRIHRVK